GFVESFDLFSVARALERRPVVMSALRSLRDMPLPVAMAKAGIRQAELDSDAWLPIAGRDLDGFAIHTASGRVFRIYHDDFPPLRLVALSVVAWAEQYATDVAAGHYCVEEGFGDCYLQYQDRDAEEAEAERLRIEEAKRDRRAAMSRKDRLEDACARK